MRNIVHLVILLCYFRRSVTASLCYPDYCQSTEDFTPIPGIRCLLTPVEKGEDCAKLTFETSDKGDTQDDSNKVSLRAYVYNLSQIATAFNLSVTEANFHGLITRYQNLLNPNQSACRQIKFYGNKTHPAPKELYVSCPFSDESYESSSYRLDVQLIGETYNYSKKYIFNVPQQRLIDEDVGVRNYTPFVYIDVSDEPRLLLHIQALPESFNVSEYRVWLMNNDTDSVDKNASSATSNREISYDFTDRTGVFYFKVSAIHSSCGDYGCANSTTPHIIIPSSHPIFIMIISTVWIPPAICCAVYHSYKLCRKVILKRRRKPTCLLVYSPTRLTHITAMNELAKYLRNSNVTVIDTHDVTDSAGNPERDFAFTQDLKDCCGAAFQSADVVLVAASPPPKKPTVSFIYKDNDNHLLQLVKENQARKKKRYYIVQLPYCKLEDVPEETRHLRRFSLPKELPNLVKEIHKMKCVGCVSDKEFLDSVKLAKLEMLEEDSSSSRDARETENLLRPSSLDNTSSVLTNGNDIVSQTFATDIGNLNLLGEAEADPEESFVRRSSTNHTGAFCVDELEL
ncbi:uncharacterized protein LOC117217969 isoform X2 [Megalopta genalis]|uniref:uncharacterized protein LOC117217969 isoform X2 n=1 Tax=Megalopta genalis TaxID=115081 RepID=UPI0014437787|nr:uncharacterized protein LOC117217969 isoform X2 [Megalopta genalis]